MLSSILGVFPDNRGVASTDYPTHIESHVQYRTHGTRLLLMITRAHSLMEQWQSQETGRGYCRIAMTHVILWTEE